MKALLLTFFVLFATSLSLIASEYQGHQAWTIKSLSQQQIDGYLSAKGMGLAKAAELNSYPGPKHVLELSKELDLSKKQIAQTNKLYKRMKQEAIKYGKLVVENEKKIDLLFATKQVNEHNLSRILNTSAKLKAELRGVHLKIHIKQRKLLTPHQIERYNQLRGYTNQGARHTNHHNQH